MLPRVRQGVLIVEDERDIAELMVDVLTEAGYTTLWCGGNEAVAQCLSFDGGPPDVILLDLLMSPMDGRQTAKALRADAVLAGIPLIVVSAVHVKRIEQVSRDLGAAGYLPKPFDWDDLLEVVRRVLDGAEA